MISYNNSAPKSVNNVGQFGAIEGSIGAYKQAAEYAADAKYWALLSQTKYSSIEEILAEVERLYSQGKLLEEDIKQLKIDFETQQQALLGLIQSTVTAIDNTNSATELSKEATQEVLAQLDIISNMTVQTTLLPPGSAATGSYDNSTGVFTFGIPEGQPGRDGTDGTISDIGSVSIGVPVSGDYGFYVDKDNGGLYRASLSDISNLVPSIRSISINGGAEQTGAVSFNSVSSFNSRTGEVVAQTGDYNVTQITGAAASGANSDITSLSGLTSALSISQGGTGATTPEESRTNLGLGSVAIEDITPISKGGTGATIASSARTNLGLGLVSTESIVPITKGGTGSTSAENARLALIAAKSGDNSDITGFTQKVAFTQPPTFPTAVVSTDGISKGQVESISLQKASNLSDLGDKVSARNNLSVYSKAELNASAGSTYIGYTKSTPNSVLRTIKSKLDDFLNIQDFGAISGVADAGVDDGVIKALNAGTGISIPAGFVYKTSKTLLTSSGKAFSIVCPNGKATIKAGGDFVLFDQPGQFKFQGCLFENIKFSGNGLTNTASRFMEAPTPNTWMANFATYNCEWDSFHTIFFGSWIAVYHYCPIFKAVSDQGYVVNTQVTPEVTFAAFNLNRMENPIFMNFRGLRIFNIVGGFNFTIVNPWFEKSHCLADGMIGIRQFFNLKIIDGWLENFVCKSLIKITTDGTENTQSDHIEIDGLHINNVATDRNFISLCLMDDPQYSGNYTDPKFTFKNLVEHSNSADGWALIRTGTSVNRAESFSVFENNRLKPGQPPLSTGGTLARSTSGDNPDIINMVRNLSTSNLKMLPRAYQTIDFMNTVSSNKQQLISDSANRISYWNVGGVSSFVWGLSYLRPGVDNAMTLGSSGQRWSSIYSTEGTIQTSDGRLKTIEDISELEISVGLRLAKSVMKYKWTEEKEEAKYHFGVIAQEVFLAFEEVGLNPLDYAVCMYDEETDSYGVNYSELNAFCLSALASKILE